MYLSSRFFCLTPLFDRFAVRFLVSTPSSSSASSTPQPTTLSYPSNRLRCKTCVSCPEQLACSRRPPFPFTSVHTNICRPRLGWVWVNLHVQTRMFPLLCAPALLIWPSLFSSPLRSLIHLPPLSFTRDSQSFPDSLSLSFDSCKRCALEFLGTTAYCRRERKAKQKQEPRRITRRGTHQDLSLLFNEDRFL